MRPAHHEPKKVEGAIREVCFPSNWYYYLYPFINTCFRLQIVDGAVRGGLFGIVTGTIFHFSAMRWSPQYRGLTTQFKTFIGLGIFVITPACWLIDQNLLRYERRIAMEQKLERRRKLEEAVEKGDY